MVKEIQLPYLVQVRTARATVTARQPLKVMAWFSVRRSETHADAVVFVGDVVGLLAMILVLRGRRGPHYLRPKMVTRQRWGVVCP